MKKNMKKLLLFLLCSTILITRCKGKDNKFFEPIKINSSASTDKVFTNFDTGFGIISIAVDDKYVWFATYDGVVVFDKVANEWGRCILENFSPSWCNIYVDADSVWVGGDRGLAKFDKIRKKWKVYTIKDGLTGNEIFEIVGSKKFIGVICRERGTGWKGLSIFDKASNKWLVHIPMSNLPNSKEYNEIYTITFDNDKIWIGAMSGLSRFNIKTCKFEDTNFYLRDIRFLLPDNDTIWLGTFGDGVWKFDEKTKNWINCNINYSPANMIMDSERIIMKRQVSFKVFDKKNAKWKEYYINKYFPSSNFFGNETFDKDFLWFSLIKEIRTPNDMGTEPNGLGLFNLTTEKFYEFNEKSGLISNNVFNICADGDYIWVGTDKGISRIDKQKLKL